MGWRQCNCNLQVHFPVIFCLNLKINANDWYFVSARFINFLVLRIFGCQRAGRILLLLVSFTLLLDFSSSNLSIGTSCHNWEDSTWHKVIYLLSLCGTQCGIHGTTVTQPIFMGLKRCGCVTVAVKRCCGDAAARLFVICLPIHCRHTHSVPFVYR